MQSPAEPGWDEVGVPSFAARRASDRAKSAQSVRAYPERSRIVGSLELVALLAVSALLGGVVAAGALVGVLDLVASIGR